MDCHFFLQGIFLTQRSNPGLLHCRLMLYRMSHQGIPQRAMKVKVEVKSFLTLCDPMGCSLPGSSIRGIFQAKVLEWVAISFSRGSSQPRNQTQVSHIAGIFFYDLSHQGTYPLANLTDSSVQSPSLASRGIPPGQKCHLPLSDREG